MVKNPFFCWCFFLWGKYVALLLLVDDFFGGWFSDLGCLFLGDVFFVGSLLFEIASKGALLKGGLDISKL